MFMDLIPEYGGSVKNLMIMNGEQLLLAEQVQRKQNVLFAQEIKKWKLTLKSYKEVTKSNYEAFKVLILMAIK